MMTESRRKSKLVTSHQNIESSPLPQSKFASLPPTPLVNQIRRDSIAMGHLSGRRSKLMTDLQKDLERFKQIRESKENEQIK